MTMEHEDFEGGARGGHGRRMVGGCWNKCKNWQEIGQDEWEKFYRDILKFDRLGLGRRNQGCKSSWPKYQKLPLQCRVDTVRYKISQSTLLCQC